MESLNIKDLFAKKPIINLSKKYENKFINKIKEHFNNEQQKLFIANFYIYLNYDAKNDYVIDLDNIWKFLGFARKAFCKRVLVKNFIENVDYKIENFATAQVGEAGKNLGGAGLNKETITMNIYTFKRLCLKSDTKKADEIHDYYIKLEEILQKIINEETNELKDQLEEKNLLLEKKN